MSMVQAFSYNFSTVENPLSDGGNFATINDTFFLNTPLQAIAGNLCEPTTTAAALRYDVQRYCCGPKRSSSKRPVRGNYSDHLERYYLR